MHLIQIYGTERSGSTLLCAQLGTRIDGALTVGEYQFVACPARAEQVTWPCVCGDVTCEQAQAQRDAADGFDLRNLFGLQDVVVDSSKQIFWYHSTAEQALRLGANVYRILILPRPEAFARSKLKRGTARFAFKYLAYNLIAHAFCKIDRVIALEDLIAQPDVVVTTVCKDLGLQQRDVPHDLHHVFGSRTTRRLGADPKRIRPKANAVTLPIGARWRVKMLNPLHRFILARRSPRRHVPLVETWFERGFWRTRRGFTEPQTRE